MFQSTAGCHAGRHSMRTTHLHALPLFQSTAGCHAGRHPPPCMRTLQTTGFNPRPAVTPAATRVITDCGALESFQSTAGCHAGRHLTGVRVI